MAVQHVPIGGHIRVFRPLKTQLRVIFALILREARVKHGRSKFGYMWTIVEPAMLIVFLTLLFNQFRPSTGAGVSFAVFFATGVLPFQLFRNMSQYVGNAMEANRPLFNYPPVQPIDAILARAILDVSSVIVVMVIVFSVQIITIDAPFPYSIPRLVLVVMLIALMGTGAGLCLAISRRFIPSISNIYTVIMGPAFFLSCVFYSLQSLPENFRKILAWNPLVHAVEGFRTGFFGGYRAPDISLMYLFWWGFILMFLGLLGNNMTKKTDL